MSALAGVLAELDAKGLLARATHIEVGDIRVAMLAAPAQQRENEEMRDRQAAQDHDDTLFGSA